MKKKILLVDNDSTYLYILQQLLKKHDIVGETAIAENGSEALQFLKNDYNKGTMPHIIILDIEMPIMTGLLLLDELKRLNLVDSTLTKIVLNSSNPRFETMDWSIKCPTVSYFQKPLLKEHISTILSE